MNLKIVVTLAVLLVFGAFSLVAMSEVGYLGIWLGGVSGWGQAQILADLIVACLLLMVWIVLDARRLGLNPWPFVLLTLLAGSFGPLLYLLLRFMKMPQAVIS
ncbi:DUF2834 domain-containing protein [Halopseudomonas pelagia]|uniref:DUF2834 domain-containing protein n=1 Tax=Halopseudomonas pelagia TaxID=553151 RepID=A0AA91U062_9GAMM|nr:DUF2834 domain-containing protein [Halopseudomonas pelagia]PCC98001.1 DUF2834 domain-containing protein [Halopseudomonas pelagia]QFY55723.1 DUF2834 domain-containing protein [Halopseudomonas pelagia]